MYSSESFNSNLILNFHNSIKEDKQHRYKSWEHSYKAFQRSKDNEFLSLHLGFYLASWGMYRGSSGLLQKDYTIHKGVVKIIHKSKYKPIHFTRDNRLRIENKDNIIELTLQLKKELYVHYNSIKYKKGEEKEKPINPTNTLLTKIMLGTLGCAPAYDRYYIDGLRKTGLAGFGLTKPALKNLFDYMSDKMDEIRKIQVELNKNSGTYYPIMKIMDMYFWSVGMELEIENKKKGKSIR